MNATTPIEAIQDAIRALTPAQRETLRDWFDDSEAAAGPLPHENAEFLGTLDRGHAEIQSGHWTTVEEMRRKVAAWDSR